MLQRSVRQLWRPTRQLFSPPRQRTFTFTPQKTSLNRIQKRSLQDVLRSTDIEINTAKKNQKHLMTRYEQKSNSLLREKQRLTRELLETKDPRLQAAIQSEIRDVQKKLVNAKRDFSDLYLIWDEMINTAKKEQERARRKYFRRNTTL